MSILLDNPMGGGVNLFLKRIVVLYTNNAKKSFLVKKMLDYLQKKLNISKQD